MLTLCLHSARVPEKEPVRSATLGLDEHCRKTRIHQNTPSTIAAFQRPQPLHAISRKAHDALRLRTDTHCCVPGASQAYLPLHDVKKTASRLSVHGNCCSLRTWMHFMQRRLITRTGAPQRNGGARRDRTDDLKLAKLPLSQLSYGPDPFGI